MCFIKYFLYVFIILILHGKINADSPSRNKIISYEHENLYINRIELPLIDLMTQETYYTYELPEKLILMVFLATWLGNYDNIVERLAIFQKSFKNSLFKVIIVVGDKNTLKKATNIFYQKRLTNINLLLDINNQLFFTMDMRSIPSSILVDNNGKILIKTRGDIGWDKEIYVNIIKEHLDKIKNTQ